MNNALKHVALAIVITTSLAQGACEMKNMVGSRSKAWGRNAWALRCGFITREKYESLQEENKVVSVRGFAAPTEEWDHCLPLEIKQLEICDLERMTK